MKLDMRHTMILTALILTIGLVGTANAGQRRNCGTATGELALYSVIAHGVTCHPARKLATRWISRVFASDCNNGRFLCYVRGYRCVARPPAMVRYRVRCVKPGRRVGWTVVAD